MADVGDSCRSEGGDGFRIGQAGEAGEEFAQVGFERNSVFPAIFHQRINDLGVVNRLLGSEERKRRKRCPL